MSLIDTMFALRRVPPFDRLRVPELLAVGEASRWVSYAPGELVLPAGAAVAQLYVACSGGFEDGEGRPLPAVAGLADLLFDRPSGTALHASRAEGAQALLVAKRHFRTLVNECPALVIGFCDTVAPTGADAAGGVR